LIKIYFHLPHYPFWYDGANKYQLNVFEYFNKHDKFVNVFGKTIEIKQSKIWVIRKLYQLVHILDIILGFLDILRIPKNSLIIITNIPFLHYFFPFILNKFWKKHKYFLIVHDLIQIERPTYFRKRLERYFIRNADTVVTISNTTKKDLIKLGLSPDRIHIVYPGLDIDRTKLPIEKIFPKTTRMLFVGSIEKRKGIFYLIEALSRLNNIEFELNLIGSHNYPEYFDSLIENIHKFNLEKKINFLGRVSDEDLADYYLNSSIFIFPTLYEGYGNAVAEAMTYGLPVIASKISPIEEFLENGKEGILVEPGNVDRLLWAIEYLINKPDKQLLFSQNSLIKAKSFLTWNETSAKIWNIANEKYAIQ
jgi:glycosyltransferase involved in cell wall biosynthesis